jgi:hypothetical protein
MIERKPIAMSRDKIRVNKLDTGETECLLMLAIKRRDATEEHVEHMKDAIMQVFYGPLVQRLCALPASVQLAENGEVVRLCNELKELVFGRTP